MDPFNAHDNDWEHVSVYMNPGNGQVTKFVYHQHGGHYTHRCGKFKDIGKGNDLLSTSVKQLMDLIMRSVMENVKQVSSLKKTVLVL